MSLFRALCLIGALTLGPSALWAKTSNEADAQELVKAAIRAMGGESQLRSIDAVSLKGIGHRYMLEQSERPEGPWLLDYFQIAETRDYRHERLRQTVVSRGCNSTECWKSAEWSAPSTVIVADHLAVTVKNGTGSAARASVVQTAEESLALAPEADLAARNRRCRSSARARPIVPRVQASRHLLYLGSSACPIVPEQLYRTAFCCGNHTDKAV
jgi:hypothetical protein